MELVSKVPEEQHDHVKEGQTVKVNFDAIPDTVFEGNVKTVGGMTTGFFFGSDAGHTFDVSILLKENERRLRPGLTADILYQGSQQKNVLYIPRQALFMKDGKRVVFVRKGGSYQRREVQIRAKAKAARPLMGWTKELKSHCSIHCSAQTIRIGLGGRQYGRSALMPLVDDDRRAQFISVSQQWTRDATWACRICCCTECVRCSPCLA